MTFSDYPGTSGRIPDLIKKDIFEKQIIDKLNENDRKKINEFYSYNEKDETYCLIESDDPNRYEFIMNKYEEINFKDMTPIVLYVSVDEYDELPYNVFRLLIGWDCMINDLSVVAE
jgi:hypothetical protein